MNDDTVNKSLQAFSELPERARKILGMMVGNPDNPRRTAATSTEIAQKLKLTSGRNLIGTLGIISRRLDDNKLPRDAWHISQKRDGYTSFTYTTLLVKTLQALKDMTRKGKG